VANSLTPLSPAFWSKTMGRKAYKSTVNKSQASYDEQKSLEIGLSVDRPYRSDLFVENYTKGSAAAPQNLTATSDKLEINKQKVILMFVDKVDKIQNKWDAAKAWAEEAGKRLAIATDAEYLYEVFNALTTIDDEDLSGVADTGITLTTSNISTVVGKINRALDEQNVDMERTNRFWNISPQIKEVLWAYLAGKETILGDKTGEYGNIGRWGGLELFVTNNLTASAIWTPANNPSNTQTITISGVVFTFVSSIGTTAGNVLIGSTTADTLDNLVALINAPTTTTVNQVGFITATGLVTSDGRIVQEMVAVDGTTHLEVRHKGKSFLTVATSDAADVWSKKKQHSMAGVKKAVDVVVQLDPNVEMASTVSNGIAGMNILVLTVFGVKTFNQGTKELVNVEIDSSLF
jgi:hypothetical protein